MDQPIVGADIDQPVLLCRLGEGHDVAVERRRVVLGYRVRSPDSSHDGKLVAIKLAGKIRADRLPGVSAVIAAKEPVGGEIQPRVRMRADYDRRVPVPAVRNVVRSRLRLNADLLSGAPIEASEIPILVFGVDGIRVFRIDDRAESVATLRKEPILIGDAADLERPRRSADAAVVLRPAVHIIEGLGIIEGDIVELRERKVALVAPIRTAIEALI